MTRGALPLVLAALLAPALAHGAVTLTRGAGDTALLGCFGPPGLAPLPSDPNIVFVACTELPVGVYPFRIGPAGPVELSPDHEFFTLPSDLNGAEPNPPQTLFIDDVWIASDSEGWLTTSGQELVVPWNPTTGAARTVLFEGSERLSVPTSWTLGGSFQRSDGTPISSFTTNFTSGVLRLGDRLLVVTSNFQQTGTTPVLNPGTVLFFDIAEDPQGRLVVSRADPFFAVTSDPNPTALTALPGGLVAVSNTGVVRTGNPATPIGPASVDLLDVASGVPLASLPLGLAAPSYREIALAPSGSVALLGSAVFRQLYAVDLRGAGALPQPPVDPRLQRPSCNGSATAEAGGVPCFPERVIAGPANPLAVPPCAGCSSATDGFTAQVRFGASGDFAVATAFNDGLLAVTAFDARNLAAPHPLLPSRFGPVQAFAVTAPVGTFGQEYGPGPLWLRASAGGGLDGTRPVWLTLAPDGSLMRATLNGSLPIPTGDADADGIEDVLDVCPLVADPLQQDSGGLGAATPDGIGDPCQCGDVGGDGRIEIDDWVRLERALASQLPPLPAPERCNVSGVAGDGPGTCAADDAARLREALAGRAVLRQICGPALP